MRKTIQCKESRIGKQPIEVPSNVKVTLEGLLPTTRWWAYLKGFEKKLQLIGVGYHATVEGKVLVLDLGFSHPVRMELPEGIQVKVEENTRIPVSGYDKSAIGQFAASVRKWRPPEPYKGKGVKYADEIVRRKEGKAGKKKQYL
ncbi:hypothetical protein Vadar_008398 [Vaccinium darrowii]|uniref:Uncharacterized protein n=1 Tax=Vaccinium darrowii TaxID=229202 RepID=A0ACB7XZ63_9ERIC|nr:hypothetical protein Vadar_008398 [Vaccinium darrowii]